MHPSSARLGSARIQLELEAFQLGSACDYFRASSDYKNVANSSWIWILIKWIQIFEPRASSISYKKVFVNHTYVLYLALMYLEILTPLFQTSKEWIFKNLGKICFKSQFKKNFSSDSARFSKTSSSARLGSARLCLWNSSSNASLFY